MRVWRIHQKLLGALQVRLPDTPEIGVQTYAEGILPMTRLLEEREEEIPWAVVALHCSFGRISLLCNLWRKGAICHLIQSSFTQTRKS